MAAEIPGSIGTSASLTMRLGQVMMSVGSILFMSVDIRFYRFTAFSYLVTIMALVIPWSLALGVADVYFVLQKHRFRKPRILLAISIADWVVSVLVLAAASSAAGVVDLIRADESFCPPRICNRYQYSATLAFLTWFLSLSSSAFNVLLLPFL